MKRTKVESPPPSDSYTIQKYAPQLTTKQGTYDLYCLGLNWFDKPGPSLAELESMGQEVAQTYKTLSNDALVLYVHVKTISVDMTCGRNNLAHAENIAITEAMKDNGNNKLFAIVNSGASNVNYADEKAAHLINASKIAAKHLVGFMLGLKNAHAYKGNRFQQSGDGSSLMSIYSSSNLTAPQLYNFGWLDERQVAQHELAFPPIVYNIQPISAANNSAYLKAVLIEAPGNQEEGKKQVFLSLFENKTKTKPGESTWSLALHTGKNGESARLNVFANTTYEGLAIDKIAEDAHGCSVRIGPRM